MGKENNLCCAIFVLINTSILLASSQFVNAPGGYSVTNFSASWDNFFSIYGGDLVYHPILARRNRDHQFFCSFSCRSTGKYSYDSCLLSIVISRNGFPDNTHLVWSANRNNPVRYKATLQFTQNGDLVLIDTDGTSVWSANTGGKSVSGIKLTEEGNLVLFDRHNATVWQSFDHPTDYLLLGQKLVPGQKLTASTPSSNWSQGLFSLAVRGDSLFAYIESNPPQIYVETNLEGNTPFVRYENGSFNWFSIPPASTGAQFMKLEPDGHLRVYEWVDSYWNVSADLLTPYLGDCGYPLVWGNYGICSSNGQCDCPIEEATNNATAFFRQTKNRQANQGCSPITPISCNYSQYHSLLELRTTSYFEVRAFAYSRNPMWDNKTTLENCKKSCLHNCTCKAALFVYPTEYQSESERGCLLISEVFSLINIEETYSENVTVFLKVQHPTTLASFPKKTGQVTVILGSSLGALFCVLLMCVAVCLCLRGKGKESKELDEIYLDQVPGMPSRFSYEDLKTMTNNFSIKLGEGGFGSVFEGTLNNGTKVAVKRLDGLGQVKKSFLAEVETIGSIHQVNLVRLIGFCAEKTYRLLVYEYMSNGSLDKWIFHRHQELTLGWLSRRKIILDIAKGLAYLHEECRQKIFHLDIKPQNILLDENLNAKVSDFGLAKLIDKDQSQVVATLRGTPGYLAPEWLNSIITEKVDVYSFGVVVMEILCGRKNLDRHQPEEEMHLLGLFERKAEEGRLQDIIDKHNDEMHIHEADVIKMMRVAAWCLQSDFVKRPSMSVVVKVLEGLMDVEANLNYSFANLSRPTQVAAAGQNEGAARDTTPLFASTLSGPR